ncbi:endonuclease/exonuclease/phosphatase family protein [Plantactinospora sp. WMMB334]|uniref:endonuclease/exonuclease/phosphatase family protein n=1 Tax=Plantactinospora sp. WMMB334 TaxID=3404119 RepID=UPI003B92F542
MIDGLRLITYNLETYRRDGEHRRYAEVEQVIGEMVSGGPAIVAVQEVVGGSWSAASRGLRHLAAVTGLRCDAGGGRHGVAAAPGRHHRLAVGLMWSPGIEAVLGSLGTVTGGLLWHALVWVTLDIGGRRHVVATYHGPPSDGRDQRRHEAKVVADTLAADRRYPTWLGADFNAPGARTVDGAYYDPDPAEAVTAGQRAAWGDKLPEIGYPTDRTPDLQFADAGFVDVAVAAGVAWAPTTGHRPTDRNGRRRLDRWLSLSAHGQEERPVEDMVIAYTVPDSALIRSASDHRPGVVDIRP